MGRNSKPLLASILGLLLVVSSAGAQPNREEAMRHFEQAEAYFKAQTYDKAVEEYLAAYEILPAAGLLFNIGLAYENAGDHVKALDYYRRYLASESDGKKAAEARARSESLERKAREQEGAIAHQEELEALRVRAQELGRKGDYDEALSLLERAFELGADPELLFDMAMVREQSGDLEIALATYRRYMAVQGTTRRWSEAAARVRDLENEIERKRAPAVTRRRSGDWRPGGITAAVGVLLTGTGIFFRLRAGTVADQLEAEIDAASPPLDARDPRIAQGRRDDIISWITLGVGSVAIVTGAVLTTRALRGHTLQVAPSASDEGAGIAIGGAW